MKNKPNRDWDADTFNRYRDHVIESTSHSLRMAINVAYDKLTEDEKVSLSMDSTGKQIPIRLIKAILIAIGGDEIEREWRTESLKPTVSKVKRILNKRRV